MAYETLLIEFDKQGIATLTLNRPDVHNAFNADVIQELHDAFLFLENKDEVRAIILKGAGKSFSAGADLNWMKAASGWSEEANIEDAMKLSSMLNALKTLAKPTIAIVHGAAMGGGAGLVACADIVLAQKGARFAFSEVRLGLLPATIGPYVVSAIGERNATRYFMTAEHFGPEVAWNLGLVSEVFDNEEDLNDCLEEICSNILKGAPRAVSSSKKLVQYLANKEINEKLRQNTAERIAIRRTSDEGKEGVSAFLEKRKPNWILDEEEE